MSYLKAAMIGMEIIQMEKEVRRLRSQIELKKQEMMECELEARDGRQSN